MTRNTEMQMWTDGSFNMVFVGSVNAPATICGGYTNVASTPLIAEKPYIVIDKATEKHSLYVPRLERQKVGATQDFNSLADVIDFEDVYVATEKDDHATISAMLARYSAVILTPGNYDMQGSIAIQKDNAILMAIGYPVLTGSNGNPVI